MTFLEETTRSLFFPPPPTTVAFSARSSKHSREASEFSMMGNIRTSLHGNGPEDGDYDNHNVTYSEKVLPDGSILRINKTVIHDTDENGNGFFFQSSVHHVFIDGEEEDEKIAGDVVVNDNEEPDMETVDDAIDETIADIISDPSKVTVLDTIEAGGTQNLM